jgi:uncharacterized membrane protein
MESTASSQVEEIGVIARTLRVFHAPSETFEAVSRRATWADWLVPTVVVLALTMASIQVTWPVLARMQSAAVEERLKGMPEEQRQQVAAQMAAVGRISGLVMVPVTGLAVLFVAGGILLLVANTVLDGQARYRQMLALWAYSSLVGIVGLVVRTPLVLAKDTAMIYTGLGVLMSEEALKTFLGRVVAGIDLFLVWQACLVAIGLGVLSGSSTRRAALPVLLLWVIWLLIQAALGGLAKAG